MTLIFIAQIFSCFFMTGVIWLVQILIYPNFQIVDSTNLERVHRFHTERITWVVAPMMVVELISGIWLGIERWSAPYFWNIISIVAVWILTVVVSVTIHNHLEQNLTATKNRLVLTNWPRTIIWTMRSAFWFWLLKKILVRIAL